MMLQVGTRMMYFGSLMRSVPGAALVNSLSLVRRGQRSAPGHRRKTLQGQQQCQQQGEERPGARGRSHDEENIALPPQHFTLWPQSR